MKVIIDLIEDIRSAINNDRSFSLGAMGLKEKEEGEFSPSWEANICSMKVDDEVKKLFLFLGKEESIGIGAFADTLNTLKNEQMMYEVYLCYAKEGRRVDSALIGYGESLADKKYLLFIPE